MKGFFTGGTFHTIIYIEVNKCFACSSRSYQELADGTTSRAVALGTNLFLKPDGLMASSLSLYAQLYLSSQTENFSWSVRETGLASSLNTCMLTRIVILFGTN